MPRVHLGDTQTGNVAENLSFFETATQGRTAGARHADQMLTWTRSLDVLWITECEEEVYHVEADLLEQVTFDSGLSD